MTQDEIIQMAKEANIWIASGWEKHGTTIDELVRFAKVVARHEREACAKIVEESSLPDTYSQECLPEIANDIRAKGQA